MDPASRGERAFYVRALALGYAAWLLAFYGVAFLASTLPSHDLTCDLDRRIPFVPAFVWPYELCYVFPFALLVLPRDHHRTNRAILAAILANVVAFAFYLFLPVAFPRVPLGEGLACAVLRLEHAGDPGAGANNLPSLHVAFAWFVFLACRGGRLGRAGDALALLVAAAITASTLLVKQHLVVDVVAGVALALAGWGAAGRAYPLVAAGTPAASLRRLARVTVPPAFAATVALTLLRFAVRALVDW